jgi:hypothetical protein
MSKFLLTLTLLLCSIATLHSQDIVVEESAAMPRIEDDWLKLLLLQNGNTAFLHLTEKEGIHLKIYNSARKIIIEKTINPTFGGNGKLGRGETITEIFRIKNDIVVFASVLVKAKPTLYRVILDGTTGNLKKEEAIGELKKLTYTGAYAMHYGFVPQPKFFVRKDPDSDNYGIALFNSFESDRNKRIELVHFGSDHQVIRRAFYSSSEDKFDYREVIDMVVLGDKQIVACVSGYNKDHEKEGYTTVASLDNSATSLRLKKLDFAKNMKVDEGVLQYNKINNLICLFGVVRRCDNCDTYSTQLTLLEPTILSTTYTKEIVLPTIIKTYDGFQNPSGSFNGTPKGFYVNHDGTYSILYQEETVVTSYDQARPQNKPRYVYTTYGSAVVSLLDDKLKDISSYLIPQSYTVTEKRPLLYLSTNTTSASHMFDENEYKQPAYVNGKTSNYTFINDIAKNVDGAKNGNIGVVSGMDRTVPYIFSITSASIERSLILKKVPAKEYAHMMFSVTDYDQESGTFTTLMLQNQKEWKLKLVWMKL